MLRDTGCAGVVVQESLVSKKQYNGKKQKCVFIDGSVHAFPIAKIYFDTPYYTGHVSVIVIQKPLYSLILGNIPGINDSCLKVSANGSTSVGDETEIAQSVTTHSQSEKAKNTTKPLKVLTNDSLNVTRKELISLQQSDASLSRCFTYACCNKKFQSGKKNYWYEVKEGLFMRSFKFPLLSLGKKLENQLASLANLPQL